MEFVSLQISSVNYFSNWFISRSGTRAPELVSIRFQLQSPKATLCPLLFISNQPYQQAPLFKNKTSIYILLFTFELCPATPRDTGIFQQWELSGWSREFENSCSPFLLKTVSSGPSQDMAWPTEQVRGASRPQASLCSTQVMFMSGSVRTTVWSSHFCDLEASPKAGFFFSISQCKTLKSEFWPLCGSEEEWKVSLRQTDSL